MWEPPTEHPLRRLFSGLTEHAFQTSLGVADPPLVDYLSDMLSRFIHFDAVNRLKNSHGAPLTELTAMAVEAEKLPAEGRTRREYHKHLGDVALFWSGLFPEHCHRIQNLPCKDHMLQFTWLGKRAYRLASEYADDRLAAESRILRRLGDEFELCAYGLREVRREWEEWAMQPLPPGCGLIK